MRVFLIIFFNVLSIACAFGSGYTLAARNYHRKLALGFSRMADILALGRFPEADEVIVAFGGEVPPDARADG